MDFEVLLLDFPSGTEKEDYIRHVLKDPSLLRPLFDLALHGSDPPAWRAAWILDGADEQQPVAAAHIPEIVSALPGMASKGAMRSLLRMLCRHEIPEEAQGLLLDLCFSCLVSASYPVAVKAHAMEIAYQHTLLYPELRGELTTILEDQMENNSVGFKSRGRRILKQLEAL